LEKQTSKPSKTISNQVKLDTSLTRQAFELIKTIIEIPSEHSIKNWQDWQDGETFLTETSTSTKYVFNSYGNPSSQINVPEAKIIQAFVDKIYVLLNLRIIYAKFFDTLPPGAYTSDHFGITTKLTPKQARKLKRRMK